jgi:hypothetical protein
MDDGWTTTTSSPSNRTSGAGNRALDVAEPVDEVLERMRVSLQAVVDSIAR